MQNVIQKTFKNRKWLKMLAIPLLCIVFFAGFLISNVAGQETPTPTPDTTVTDLLTAENGVLILLIIWIIFLGLSFSVKEHKEIVCGFTGIIQLVFAFSLMPINSIIGIVIAFFALFLFYMALSNKDKRGK